MRNEKFHKIHGKFLRKPFFKTHLWWLLLNIRVIGNNCAFWEWSNGVGAFYLFQNNFGNCHYNWIYKKHCRLYRYVSKYIENIRLVRTQNFPKINISYTLNLTVKIVSFRKILHTYKMHNHLRYLLTTLAFHLCNK